MNMLLKNRKLLSFVLTLMLILTAIPGMTITASADTYDVTYSCTNATCSGSTTSSGIVNLTVTPSAGYSVPSVAVTSPAGNTAVITRTEANAYTISNITSDITVSVVGATPILDSVTTYTVTQGGVYYLACTNTALTKTVNIDTTADVTIKGDQIMTSTAITPKQKVCFYPVAGANLTLEDVSLSNNLGSGSSTSSGGIVVTGMNLIDFTGSGNNLYLAGTNLLETVEYVAAAGIHVPDTAELTIDASPYCSNGTLYMYKYSQGSGIGGNANKANGEIIFDGGNIFIKGSKTGAVVGNDTYNDALEQAKIKDIHINGGNLNIVNKAQGAGIGGSRMSIAGDVYVAGGCLTLVTDFSAPVVGAGAQKTGATSDGSIHISGGSVKTMVMDNAYSSWGTAGAIGTEMTISQTGECYYVTDGAIAATKYNANSDAVAVCVVTMAAIDNNAIYVDDELYYEGGLHQYCYTDCTMLTPASTYTMDNWGPVPAADNCNLYLYLTKDYHEVEINDVMYDCYWDDSTGFTLTIQP